MSVLGQLAKVAKAKPLRSTLDEAVEALARPKGTGAEYLKEIEKTKGVKPTEIKERGIDKVLANLPKVNKEEIVKAVQSKANPAIEEKVLGAGTYKELTPKEAKELKEMVEEHKRDELHPSHYTYMVDLLNRSEKSTNQSLEQKVDSIFDQIQKARANGQTRLARELSDEMDVLYDRQQRLDKVVEDPTKYGQYTIPNGQNYREILLRLPQKEGEQFQSGHFEEPNILAHMRIADRTGPNGEKILHLEELQSDWHQKGRKQGYKEAKEPVHAQAYDAYIKDLMNRYHERLRETYGNDYNISMNAERDPTKVAESMGELDTLQDNFARMYQERNQQNVGVPDAPFKKNWHEVALKKLINYATENGYDKIAITPGAEQSKRYDLSKQISKVKYFDDPSTDSGVLHAYDLKGNNVLNQSIPKDKIQDYVGKDIAQKLLEQPQEKHGRPNVPMYQRELSGLDLQVGGEGMKGFYDKILPDYLNKLGKPHGAEVQLHGMPVKVEGGEVLDPDGLGFVSERAPSVANLHTFDLTPSLKNEVTQKGLPLYQQVGIPLVGAEAVNEAQPEMKRGGKVTISNNPDAMFMELNDKKFGIGGIVKALTPMEEALAKMKAMKQAMAPEIALNKRYEEATKDMYTKDMPSFEEWKKTLPPPEVK
jgi:hypothetical protein